MSGRNGIAGRRGGREAASAPVSDDGAGELLARLLIERDELRARAKRAETEARALRKKVQSLEARLRKGKRPYRRGKLTAEKAVRIMAEEGWRTQDGNPPSVRWIYRVNHGDIPSPLWFPVGLKCTEDAFRQMVIDAVAEQREIAEMGYTPREAARAEWYG